MTQLNVLYGMSPLTYKEKQADTKWKDFFGIELEVEGCSHREPFGAWTIHNDGSLRDGTEFVLHTPLGGSDLEKAIDSFYKVGMAYTSGPRTSTHIHVNMRDASVDTLRSMSMVVYMLEDAIFNSVGESRKWSGYSVGLNEMDQRRLRSIMSSNDQKTLHGAISPARNQERYYGFNTASFRKHGTVEFRYFPGGPTKEELTNWVNLVAFIKAIGKKYTPEELTYRISDEVSLRAFLDLHFDPYWVNEFARHDSTQSLLDKFNVVSALGHEPDDLARRDDIVFVNPTFLSFIMKNVLKEEGRKYLEPLAKKIVATSVGEWCYYLEEARNRDIPKRFAKGSLKNDDVRDVDPFEDVAPVGRWGHAQPAEPEAPRPDRMREQYQVFAGLQNDDAVQRALDAVRQYEAAFVNPAVQEGPEARNMPQFAQPVARPQAPAVTPAQRAHLQAQLLERERMLLDRRRREEEARRRDARIRRG